MKLNVLIVLFLVFTQMNCQSSRRKSGRRRVKQTYKLKKVDKNVDVTTRVQCLECSIEFGYLRFDPNNLCYNPALNFSLVKHKYVTICPLESRFCQTEIIRVNGVFIGINRKCGISSCLEACFQKGFGVERESCTFCCNGIQPQDFNEETGKAYNCP